PRDRPNVLSLEEAPPFGLPRAGLSSGGRPHYSETGRSAGGGYGPQWATVRPPERVVSIVGAGVRKPAQQPAQQPTCGDRKKFQVNCDTAALNERSTLRRSEVVEPRGGSGRREKFRLRGRRIGLGP